MEKRRKVEDMTKGNTLICEKEHENNQIVKNI